jgi:hypothetical protein
VVAAVVMCYMFLSHLVMVGWIVGSLGFLLNLKDH